MTISGFSQRVGTATRVRTYTRTSHRDVKPYAFTRLAAVPAKRVSDLTAIFNQALVRFMRRFDHKFVSTLSEGDLKVRVPEDVLLRLFELTFEGMCAAGLWPDGKGSALNPVLCKNLNGYSAVVEMADECITLSAGLMRLLATQDAVGAREVPGWQLVKARDLIEKHGGRMFVVSPRFSQTSGAVIRIYLPLSPSAPQRQAFAESLPRLLAAVC